MARTPDLTKYAIVMQYLMKNPEATQRKTTKACHCGPNLIPKAKTWFATLAPETRLNILGTDIDIAKTDTDIEKVDININNDINIIHGVKLKGTTPVMLPEEVSKKYFAATSAVEEPYNEAYDGFDSEESYDKYSEQVDAELSEDIITLPVPIISKKQIIESLILSGSDSLIPEYQRIAKRLTHESHNSNYQRKLIMDTMDMMLDLYTMQEK